MNHRSTSVTAALPYMVLGVSAVLLSRWLFGFKSMLLLFGAGAFILASILLVAALRPDARLSQRLLSPSTRNVLSQERWLKLREYLILAAAGQYFLALMPAFMFFVTEGTLLVPLIGAGVCGCGAMVCFALALVKRLKLREA